MNVILSFSLYYYVLPKGFQKMNIVSTLLEELIKSAPWEVRPKFTLQIQFQRAKWWRISRRFLHLSPYILSNQPLLQLTPTPFLPLKP